MSDSAAPPPLHHIILYSLSSASILCHSLCINWTNQCVCVSVCVWLEGLGSCGALTVSSLYFICTHWTDWSSLSLPRWKAALVFLTSHKCCPLCSSFPVHEHTEDDEEDELLCHGWIIKAYITAAASLLDLLFHGLALVKFRVRKIPFFLQYNSASIHLQLKYWCYCFLLISMSVLCWC